MRTGSALWFLMLASVLVAGGALFVIAGGSAEQPIDPEVPTPCPLGSTPRPLKLATRAEIEQAALDYSSATGTPTILLSGAVRNDDLPRLGLDRIDSSANLAPLYLVFLEGDFDAGGILGGHGPARYILYIFDLYAGAPTFIATSPDSGHFSKLLNDPPELPSDPLPAESDPNKLPYGILLPGGIPPGRIRPVTVEGAIGIADHAADLWGEPNPEVVSVARIADEEYLDQLRADFADPSWVNTSEVWLVRLSGRFVIRDGAILRPVRQYNVLEVVIDAGTGEGLRVTGLEPVCVSP